jgi:polysaccharide export outer membrane protein
MEIYGHPELDTTAYVAEDGTVRLPLAGPVQVTGLSPEEAARKVEQALRIYFPMHVPQVRLTALPLPAEPVRVIGAIKLPGHYPVEASSTLLDILALAGGRTADADDRVWLLRQDASGKVLRIPIDLSTLVDAGGQPLPQTPPIRVYAGDRLYVPAAPQVYVTGEVRASASYRLESGMTLQQALQAAGGVTRRGSIHRVQIKRHGPDGTDRIVYPVRLSDPVQAGDVIVVRKRQTGLIE